MKNHITTLVVDFDDTLAITYNRDWANAEPNTALINRLNYLFDQGWTIHIVTARGQLSCDGSSERADKKYRAQIESWLKTNHVKYTDLSFQKKLAAYYIDDKGITPDKFLESFGRTQLKGGWSGAEVYYDHITNTVFKQAGNTLDVVKWYEAAESYCFKVPKIISVIGDTIQMECLEEFQFSEKNVEGVIHLLHLYSKTPKISRDVQPRSYYERCTKRVPDSELTESQKHFLSAALINAYGTSLEHQSFSHGDFSANNLMQNFDGELVMIDPIFETDLLSSWLIDAAKLYMTLALNKPFSQRETEHFRSSIEKFVIEHFKGSEANAIRALKTNEIAHLCRVYPYATDTDKVKAALIEALANYEKTYETE